MYSVGVFDIKMGMWQMYGDYKSLDEAIGNAIDWANNEDREYIIFKKEGKVIKTPKYYYQPIVD